MKKLELKHLCGYLPYLLKGIEFIGAKEYVLERISANNEFLWSPNYDAHERPKYSLPKRIDCIPLLLPLSALTEPLEDGSVPIVELAKMAWDKSHLPDKFLYQSLKDDTVFIAFSDKKNCFGYDVNTSSFFGVKEGKCISVVGQLQLFEYLYQNHFDIHRRIPARLAIDKRTVK